MNTKMANAIILLLSITIFFSPTNQAESITGRKSTCLNEGEDVTVHSITDIGCYKCKCVNGFVECDPECPIVEDCYMLLKKAPGDCCDRCKGCYYKGANYSNNAEWSDPDDPCATFKCVAGVVTESNIQCYTPCSQPSYPLPGQCCPTCVNGCNLNGQKVDSREVTSSEDPCLKCRCSNNRLTCIKKACPVLQCPLTKQFKPPGECCPRCNEKKEVIQVPGKCILGKGFHSHGKRFNPDPCSSCTCLNGTSVCKRNTCPVLECPHDQQKISPGNCCPHCPPIAEARSTCSYEGKSFQHNDTWELGPCRSCKCHSGEIRCAQTKCTTPKCRPNETLVTPTGQCCPVCIENDGICTVFGDPHYRTFDGKFFSFQGTCKYLLSADAVNHSFSIRVTNGARLSKSSWTKTVTLKLGTTKVNLGQKQRVKVNGKSVTIPHKEGNIFNVRRYEDGLIIVETGIGIKMLWDGSNYLQVQVPSTFKNKLIGLCGNFNNVWRDDLMSRKQKIMPDSEVTKFGDSWRVGGIKSCARKPKTHLNNQVCRRRKEWIRCRALKDPQRYPFFSACESHLNHFHYFEACRMDMCECPTAQCYCESFAAYARECKRLGVTLPNWRQETNCSISDQLYNRYHLSNNVNVKNKKPNFNTVTVKSDNSIANGNDLNRFSKRMYQQQHNYRHHLNRTKQIPHSQSKEQQQNQQKSQTNRHHSHSSPTAILHDPFPNAIKSNRNHNLGRTPPPLH